MLTSRQNHTRQTGTQRRAQLAPEAATQPTCVGPRPRKRNAHITLTAAPNYALRCLRRDQPAIGQAARSKRATRFARRIGKGVRTPKRKECSDRQPSQLRIASFNHFYNGIGWQSCKQLQTHTHARTKLFQNFEHCTRPAFPLTWGCLRSRRILSTNHLRIW